MQVGVAVAGWRRQASHYKSRHCDAAVTNAQRQALDPADAIFRTFYAKKPSSPSNECLSSY
jgi:hypothetical protein